MKSVRNRFRFSLLRPTLDDAPRLVERAPAAPVAVLAPHPDDDVIGCGGTLYKHRQAGEAVTVIYLTDGGRGNDWKSAPSPELADRRRLEAEAAAQVLGIGNPAFLGFTDGELAPTPVVIDRVLEALAAVSPRCVFLPSPLDEHPDHQAANRIFAALVPRLRNRVTVFSYEVWTPLDPNRLVDISGAAAVKEKAIRRHASQVRHIDYAGAALGLNRFRSLSLGSGCGFYEAFFAAEAKAYAALVKEILGP